MPTKISGRQKLFHQSRSSWVELFETQIFHQLKSFININFNRYRSLFLYLNCLNRMASFHLILPALISLINVKSRLLILKKKIHPPTTFSPSKFVDFLGFFHPPLLVYCSYVLVFSKKSHPPTRSLFQSPHLLIQELLHPLHVYSSHLGY